METNQTLYDIFTEYRNGNKDIIANLFNIKGIGEKRSVECAVPDVNQMAKSAYNCYLLNGINTNGQYRKYSYGAFNGTLEDMMSIFAETLQDIFFDNLDKPVKVADNRSLYALLKTEVSKRVNAILKIKDAEIHVQYKMNESKQFHKDKYDNYSIDRLDEYAYMKYIQESASMGHLSFFNTCLDLLKNFDITEMLQKNNVIAKNIIKLFALPETLTYNIYGDADVISNSEVVELYNKTYNSRITDERVSECYNIIFELLMKKYYGYVPVSRKEYRQKNKPAINKGNDSADETIIHKATLEEVRNIQDIIQKKQHKSNYIRPENLKLEERTA